MKQIKKAVVQFLLWSFAALRQMFGQASMRTEILGIGRMEVVERAAA
jgi:hypothetical protein